MTEQILHIDFETRSAADLRVVGLHKYARDPSTDVWCMAAALNDGEIALFVRPFAFPTAGSPYLEHVANGLPVYAHNAPFELEIWNQIMVPRYGWPPLRPEQTYCTMAMCYAMGLPGSLDDATVAMKLPEQKDSDGHAIMMRYARPWRCDPIKWMDECPSFTVNAVKRSGKEGLQRLYEYCQQDVRAERELHRHLRPLSEQERRVWLLDYQINQRGVAVDVKAANAAIKIADALKEQYDNDMAEVTEGVARSCNALAPIKQFLADHGLPQALTGLARQDVADFLERDDLVPAARRVLVLRSEASKASAAKFNVMADRASDAGRLHGMYQYHGAGTGRWAARGVQPHNLVRNMPAAAVVEDILGYVQEGNHQMIDLLYGPPLSEITRCLRSFFVAPPGKLLVSGDWSNVEGRGQAWFAGEQWKIEAFKAADEKRGPGLYELAYARMFNVPVESVKNPSEERQVGKVSELAFGYQGGVGSFTKMGKVYGVKVPDAKAAEFRDAWRVAHKMIVNAWYRIEDAAKAAVRDPGTAYYCGYPGRQAAYKMVGTFLWCRLPSGRVICFPFPKLLKGEYGDQLTYMAQPGQDVSAVVSDPQNCGRWARFSTYGGALFNRIVQGFCRDFLAETMLALDAAGAKIVLHTHDDINIEVGEAKAEGARAAMQQMMRKPPVWATGFPLHADCKVMRRYGK